MKLFAVVIFLSWTAVSFPRALAQPPPGILVRLSERGIQYAAKKIMDWVDFKIDPGMRFSDQKGAFQLKFGNVEYLMSEIVARDFNWYEVNGGIIPGVGVSASFHRISVSISGKFEYVYTVASIPTSNSGTLSVTISDVSLYVNATAGMAAGGKPTVDFPGCSASIGNMDIKFETATVVNWILELFKDTIKANMKPILTGAICKAVKDGRYLIEKQIANYTKPCLDRSCHFLIDLRFVSPPVFGKGFIEAAFQGQIFWKSDKRLAPFKALPFRRLQVSSKMADLYVNAYVLNTLLYAVHQNDLLSYEFTRNDLPRGYHYLMNTSCTSNSCIGKLLPDIFSRHPEATVELDVIATKSPFLNISDKGCSIALGGNIKIQIRNSTGSVTTLGVLALEGYAEMSVSINSQGKVAFKVKEFEFTSARISDKETNGKIRLGKNVAEVLRSATGKYVLPKLNEIGKKGLSILHFGKLSANSSFLMLVQNAFVLTTDVTYSKAKTAKTA